MLIIAAASLLLVVWGLFTLDWYKVGLGIFIFLACFAVDLYKKRAVLTDDKLAAADVPPPSVAVGFRVQG